MVQALLGEGVPDHTIARERLLARTDEGFVGLRALGPSFAPRKAQAIEAVPVDMAESTAC